MKKTVLNSDGFDEFLDARSNSYASGSEEYYLDYIEDEENGPKDKPGKPDKVEHPRLPKK
jgi:hypothetical protein